jgi:hypothetical protein
LYPKCAHDNRYEQDHGPRVRRDPGPQHSEPCGNAVPNDFPIVDHSLSLEVRGDAIREALGSPEHSRMRIDQSVMSGRRWAYSVVSQRKIVSDDVGEAALARR